eukprot:Opistho-2@73353
MVTAVGVVTGIHMMYMAVPRTDDRRTTTSMDRGITTAGLRAAAHVGAAIPTVWPAWGAMAAEAEWAEWADSGKPTRSSTPTGTVAAEAVVSPRRRRTVLTSHFHSECSRRPMRGSAARAPDRATLLSVAPITARPATAAPTMVRLDLDRRARRTRGRVALASDLGLGLGLDMDPECVHPPRLQQPTRLQRRSLAMQRPFLRMRTLGGTRKTTLRSRRNFSASQTRPAFPVTCTLTTAMAPTGVTTLRRAVGSLSRRRLILISSSRAPPTLLESCRISRRPSFRIFRTGTAEAVNANPTRW